MKYPAPGLMLARQPPPLCHSGNRTRCRVPYNQEGQRGYHATS